MSSIYARRFTKYGNYGIIMSMYDNILFDLDGTIINSKKGVSDSLRFAFAQNGVSFDGDYTIFIGPPFKVSFPKFLGSDEALTQKLISSYREHYAKIGVKECTLYRGIRDLLVTLKRDGKKIGLATTKPRRFAEEITKRKKIFRLFDIVSGTEPSGFPSQKDEVVRIVMDKLQAAPDRTVLVGDTIYDCIGATECGIDCIGVSYGFGDAADLVREGAKLIADSPKTLKNLLK